MLRLSTAPLCSVFIVGFLLSSSATAQVFDHYWFHDPPYVDPFFNQDGTAKTTYANGYTTRPRHPGHGVGHGFGHGLFCTHCGHQGVSNGGCSHCGVQQETMGNGGYCAQCGIHHGGGNAGCLSCMGGMNGDRAIGRRGPICPEITTARLQVYVPDCYQVEVNGQKTRLQTLGGIHRNSRVFTLDELIFESSSPTDVVVIECDRQGNKKRHTAMVYAQAGETYRVRYPGDFTLTAYLTPDGLPVPSPWPVNQGQVMPLSTLGGQPSRIVDSLELPQTLDGQPSRIVDSLELPPATDVLPSPFPPQSQAIDSSGADSRNID